MSSALNTKLTKKSSLATGIMLGTNSNRHYQTMEDMLGGTIFHNVNSYAIGDYPITDHVYSMTLTQLVQTTLVNLSMRVTNSVTTIVSM